MIEAALKLAELRAAIESETGQRIYELDLNAGFFLHDICCAIGLNGDQRRLVLGGEHVETMLDSPIAVRTRSGARVSRVTRVHGARALRVTGGNNAKRE